MRSALCMVSVILILTNTQLSIIVVAIFIQHSWKFDVNITRIESRPVQSNSAKFDFFVDFYGRVGDTNVNALLQELKGMTDKLLVLDEKEVSHIYLFEGVVYASINSYHAYYILNYHSASQLV